MDPLVTCILVRHRFLPTLLVAMTAPAPFLEAAQGSFVPGEVLVKIRAATAANISPAAVTTPPGMQAMTALGATGWRVVKLPPGMPVAQGVLQLRGSPEFSAAEPNYRYRLHATSNDPHTPALWALRTIEAPAAWDTTTGSSNVIVAVMDTGIDYTHPDLVPNLWRNSREIPDNRIDDDASGVIDDVYGADFVEDDGDPTDDAGHGSHVAGTIAAVGNNALGITGVAWRTRLLSVRILAADGAADTAGIIRAFDYLRLLRQRGENIRVVNASWGSEYASQAIAEGIQTLANAGILLVCSAGNERLDTDTLPTFPACVDNPAVLAVTATDPSDALSVFSNFGVRTIHLAAPGQGILSTYHGGDLYAQESGTSMASPHVTGVAALLLAAHTNLTLPQLKALILNSADPIPAAAGVTRTGGRLNARRALLLASTANPLPTNSPAPVAPTLPLVLASRSSSSLPGNEPSRSPSISADGRFIAFVSTATNLVANDTNQCADVFLRDLQAGTTVRVSETTAHIGGNADSSQPVISANGQFVAFTSLAKNLVAGDPNTFEDVFIYNRTTRALELAGARNAGGWPSGASSSPSISADGRYVAFQSNARNVAGTDNNAVNDVFLRDRTAKTTELISRTSSGSAGSSVSEAPSLSADARYVAFHSFAFNLVANDNNGNYDVFVRDRTAKTTTLASATPGGSSANADSGLPRISADGRYVAFESFASDLVTGSATAVSQIYLRNLAARTNRRVTNFPDFQPLTGNHYLEAISGDGRFVAFTTDTAHLPPSAGTPLAIYRPFLFDQHLGTLTALAFSPAGYPAENNTFDTALSPDARFVAFASWGSRLTPADGNGVADVFVLDRTATPADLSIRSSTSANWIGAGLTGPGIPQRAQGPLPSPTNTSFLLQLVNIGSTGTTFVIQATPPPPGCQLRLFNAASGGTDVTTDTLGTGWTTPLLPPAATQALRLELSAAAPWLQTRTGTRILALSSNRSNTLDAVTAVALDHLHPPGLQLVSIDATGAPADRAAESPSVSQDGRYIAFSSVASHLAANDTNWLDDIFIHNTYLRSTWSASTSASGQLGNGPSRHPSISRDGRIVVFDSEADNLVANDTNRAGDIFVKNLASGAIERVNLGPASTQASRGAAYPATSADGRFVLFESVATNLVPGTTPNTAHLFLRDRSSATTECISRVPGGPIANADSFLTALSGDGRFVVFSSYASNLTPSDTNGFADLFLLDRSSRTLELLSATAHGTPANGPSHAASITDDGRLLILLSSATNLVPNTPEEDQFACLLDRAARQLTPLSRLITNLPPGTSILNAKISPDSRWIALSLTTGSQTNPAANRAFAQTWLHDRSTGHLQPVTQPTNGATTTLSFAGSGRHLILASDDDSLLGEYNRSTSEALLFDRATFQPDIALRRESATDWQGDGMFHSAQTTELVVNPDTPAFFLTQVRNASEFPDSFRISSPPSGTPGHSVRFFDPLTSQEITALLQSDGWFTPTLPPGSTLGLRSSVTLLTTNASDVPCRLTAQSTTSPGAADAASILLRADVDRDTLPDSWERSYFASAAAVTATSDQDADGASAWAEYVAGTQPSSGDSCLRILSFQPNPQGTFDIRWAGVVGRSYEVQYAPGPTGSFHSISPRIPGIDGTLAWITPSPSQTAPSCYRIVAFLP